MLSQRCRVMPMRWLWMEFPPGIMRIPSTLSPPLNTNLSVWSMPISSATFLFSSVKRWIIEVKNNAWNGCLVQLMANINSVKNMSQCMFSSGNNIKKEYVRSYITHLLESSCTIVNKIVCDERKANKKIYYTKKQHWPLHCFSMYDMYLTWNRKHYWLTQRFVIQQIKIN